MAKMKNFDHRLRFTLIKRIIPLVCVLFLAGCQNLPFPFNGELVTNSTQPMTTTTTQSLGTTSGSTTSETGTGAADTTSVTIPQQPTRVIALDKFKASRLTRSSEKMTHLWSVESEFPLKTGENIAESNYGPDGKVTTAKGSVLENYAGKETKTVWYLTKDKFILEQGTETKSFLTSEVAEQHAYDFDRLVEIILTKYSVSEDTGTYVVKVTTQDEQAVQELMECLGYRKTAKDIYKGSLYLEALFEAATGNLRTVNYMYKNTLEGFTDNGQVTFSAWNVPVTVEVPRDEVPSTVPVGTTTAPPGTQASLTTPTATAATASKTTPKP